MRSGLDRTDDLVEHLNELQYDATGREMLKICESLRRLRNKKRGAAMSEPLNTGSSCAAGHEHSDRPIAQNSGKRSAPVVRRDMWANVARKRGRPEYLDVPAATTPADPVNGAPSVPERVA